MVACSVVSSRLVLKTAKSMLTSFVLASAFASVAKPAQLPAPQKPTEASGFFAAMTWPAESGLILDGSTIRTRYASGDTGAMNRRYVNQQLVKAQKGKVKL